MAFRSAAVPGGAPRTTSLSLTIPADVVTDDILVVGVINGGADADPSVSDDDTGGNAWTKKYTQTHSTDGSRGTIWWKRATANTASKTISVTGCTDSCAGYVSVYSGRIATGDPFDSVGTSESNAAGDESHASITPTTNGCDVCFSVLCGDNDAASTVACTDPGSLTIRAQDTNSGGVDTNAAIADAPQSTANATGAFTWAQIDDVTVSFAFALLPASGPSDTPITPGEGSSVMTGVAGRMDLGIPVPTEVDA